MSHARLIGWGGLALSFALSIALYARLPATMPIHLSWQGVSTGTAARPVGAFLMPVVGVIMYAITCAVLRRQHASESLAILPLLMVGLFLVLHVLMLRAAFDPTFEGGRIVLICASAFKCVFGNYLGKLRRNRWIGIRTPWTLASDEVWLRTHRFGGRLFIVTGALALCVLTAGARPQLGVAILLSSGAISIVYSYVIARRLAQPLAR